MIKDKTQANKHIFKSENIMVLNENTGEIIEENVIRREKTNEVIDIKFLKIWPEYLINYLLNCKNSRCIVFGFLLLHRNRRNRVYKTQREIAEETQISLPTVNKTLKELKLRSSYGINIMAIKRGEDIDISPKAEDRLSEDDIIVAIGSADDLSNLEDILIRKK